MNGCPRLILSLLATALVAWGCNSEVDLSALKFLPPGTTLDQSGDLGQKDLDQSDPGDSTTDMNTIDNPYADIEVDVYCFDILYCLVYENFCFDFNNENCFNACADGEIWQADPATRAMYQCLNDCASSGNEAVTCAQERCPDAILGCMVEEYDDDGCADVVDCQRSKCDNEFASDEDTFVCQADCTKNASSDAISQLVAVGENCSMADGEQETPQKAQACLNSVVDCFAGSGNKSCKATLDCAILCGCLDGSTFCQEKTDCILDCYYGAELKEDLELTQARVACSISPMANPFDCLYAELQCRNPIDGELKCGQFFAQLGSDFYSNVFVYPENFENMSRTLRKLDSANVPQAANILKCLRDAWDADPGYNTLDKTEWDACTQECF